MSMRSGPITEILTENSVLTEAPSIFFLFHNSRVGFINAFSRCRSRRPFLHSHSEYFIG